MVDLGSSLRAGYQIPQDFAEARGLRCKAANGSVCGLRARGTRIQGRHFANATNFKADREMRVALYSLEASPSFVNTKLSASCKKQELKS